MMNVDFMSMNIEMTGIVMQGCIRCHLMIE